MLRDTVSELRDTDHYCGNHSFLAQHKYTSLEDSKISQSYTFNLDDELWSSEFTTSTQWRDEVTFVAFLDNYSEKLVDVGFFGLEWIDSCEATRIYPFNLTNTYQAFDETQPDNYTQWEYRMLADWNLTDDQVMHDVFLDLDTRDLWSNEQEIEAMLTTIGQEDEVTQYVYYQGDFISDVRELRYFKWDSCGTLVFKEFNLNKTKVDEVGFLTLSQGTNSSWIISLQTSDYTYVGKHAVVIVMTLDLQPSIEHRLTFNVQVETDYVEEDNAETAVEETEEVFQPMFFYES